MSTFTFVIGMLVAPVKALAGSPYFGLYCSALGTYCGDGQGFIIHLAVRTANVLVIPFVGGLGVIGILVAAIKMHSSFGNDQGKEEAKKIIILVAVGITLAVTGVGIVNWVCHIVESTTGGSGYCA